MLLIFETVGFIYVSGNVGLIDVREGVEAMWPDRRLLDLIGIEIPVIQAPMAGANGSAMAIAVSEAGGLGSLPCGMLGAAKARAEIARPYGYARQSP